MAECGKWSRLLKKRELASYVVLCLGREAPLNYGDAVDLLRSQLSLDAKSAHSVVKRLARLGLLEKVGPLTFKCVDPRQYLVELAKSYSCRKRKRGSAGR